MNKEQPDIIFISPPFFNYEKFITNELRSLGHRPCYISGKKGKIWDFFISFLSLIKQKRIYSRHIFKKLEKINIENVDLLFVIKGENVTKQHIQYLKSKNSQLRCIMYQWDSVKNFDYRDLASVFDKVTTFDFNDAQTFHFDYQPLFYTRDIHPVKNIKEDIDILLIGTYIPLRYRYCKKFLLLAKQLQLKMYAHIFVAPSFYLKSQILGNNKLCLENWKDVSIVSIPRKKLIEYYRRSKVILDVSHPEQSGMSMRFIEAYGMNKKVITSNKYFALDPNVNEIQALSCEAGPEEIRKFLNAPLKSYINRGNLSINNWLSNLLY